MEFTQLSSILLFQTPLFFFFFTSFPPSYPPLLLPSFLSFSTLFFLFLSYLYSFFSFCFFLFWGLERPSHTQVCSGITPAQYSGFSPGGLYIVLGIKPRPAMCKSSTLHTLPYISGSQRLFQQVRYFSLAVGTLLISLRRV